MQEVPVQICQNKRKDFSHGPSPKEKGLKHPSAEYMLPLGKPSDLTEALLCLGAQLTERVDEMTGC